MVFFLSFGQWNCGFEPSSCPSGKNWVRISRPKIDKLACQTQGADIFAMGEYPGFTPRFEGVLFHYNYLKRFIAFQNPA